MASQVQVDELARMFDAPRGDFVSVDGQVAGKFDPNDPAADKEVEPTFFDKITIAIEDGKFSISEAELTPAKNMHATVSDELTHVYQFDRAPKNAKEMARLLISKYPLAHTAEAELTTLVEDLQKLGFEVEAEHGFLVESVDSAIKDGTVDVAEELVSRLDKPTNETSWGTAGLIAALGLGFSTAMAAVKNRSKNAPDVEVVVQQDAYQVAC